MKTSKKGECLMDFLNQKYLRILPDQIYSSDYEMFQNMILYQFIQINSFNFNFKLNSVEYVIKVSKILT